MKLDEAIRVVDIHGREMLDRPDAGIELVAVGTKERRPLDEADDFCVTAFVKEKLTSSTLKDRAMLRFSETFAAVTDRREPEPTEIDVVECGSAFVPYVGLSVPKPHRGRFGGPLPVCDSQRWFSALRCGIGIANPTGEYPGRLGVGTAGFYMRDGGGRKYLVSNNHVIGRTNAALPGEIVVQPGTLDLTTPELQAMPTPADLTRALGIAVVTAVAPLQFKTPQNIPLNRVDAALARLLDEPAGGRTHADLDRLTFAGGICGVGRPFGPGGGSVRVHKVGRTTGFTEGRITEIGGTATLPYPGGWAHFTNLIVIDATMDNRGPFGLPGDSGSAILNERNELVALLFGGAQGRTIANPIELVIGALRQVSGLTDLQVITS